MSVRCGQKAVKTSKDSYPVICYILMFYISYLHQLSMESNGISIIISLISILASILLAIQNEKEVVIDEVRLNEELTVYSRIKT